MSYALKTDYKKILADTITPVSVYLKIRDKFPGSILLESSDYHANDNSFSYICFNPIAHIEVKNKQLTQSFPDGSTQQTAIVPNSDIPAAVTTFSEQFKTEKQDFKFITQGLFGFMTYDAVQYFEDIAIHKKEGGQDLPELYYAVYRNVIAINHFNNEAYIFAHSYEQNSNIAEIEQLIAVKNFATYPFKTEGKPKINIEDQAYMKLVETAKQHCQRGDVFQLVLSRRFSQQFSGDEFNVYRALRSINPSPYLFFFDYGNFKIFGSSPEAQLVVKDNKAEIHPIAGTFKRSGNDEKDAQLAKSLTEDHKENAEHVMLVDLARNDLSRHGKMVAVENYREVQFFSHVIHLVSKVTGMKKPNTPTMSVVADTFPAGTLSGAPKHKAMELIEKYEPTPRGYYGGAIGFMDFQGNFNHAIMIRTFLSKNHELQYQAGAGIVAASDAASELQETYNKLGALTKALEIAQDIV
ncbi:MAG: anthranilate synthase component I family protein [Flavobacteriaceae bacterium]|nr:anthranilate synthase component I family protein [Flavobacteriaceae bacterium]MCI5089048.1 anthranilate synthase component I family protein [Flavobacteriaceae bacterium]